jgi:hypothetical protein
MSATSRFFLYCSYLSCATMSSQKLPLQRHLPPATSITFPAPSRTTLHGYTASSTTNFVIWGSNIDSTVVGGVLDWDGHSSLYPSVFHIPRSTETLTHACTHTLGLRLLAFYSASKTENRKTPTHMSLPATWWLLSTYVASARPLWCLEIACLH